MRGKRLSVSLKAASAIVTASLLITSAWAAPREKVLHSFRNNSKGGVNPYAGLIFDTAGNLYGTTVHGGAHCCGTVFELTPKAGGGWTEKVLHNFPATDRDGQGPGAVIFDSAGNLYGTTGAGGAYDEGIVFELTPETGGGWTEKILHAFGNGRDGIQPYAALAFDTAGNLFGTTSAGGAYNGGTVFELMPRVGGGWTEKVLHEFGNGSDGSYPVAVLTLDSAGNLYGTTVSGGSGCVGGCGTVFELTPKAGGRWTENVLHNFDHNGRDGFYPTAGLLFDAAGNLYGTTEWGGAYDSGIVFELTPKASEGWTERVLRSFNITHGRYPSPLILDAAGNLYGTTSTGGAYDWGTVFELTHNSGGGWTEKVLHNFDKNGRDGTGPNAGVVFDAVGNLFGTTVGGGDTAQCGGDGCGTVFEITP
jgi:uncharacterized repeat protein (TIGR03803 family)